MISRRVLFLAVPAFTSSLACRAEERLRENTGGSDKAMDHKNGQGPVKAYNIDVLHRSANRSVGSCQGWCFGLPPGISADHWPLDPLNGYPLMHGFTCLLPEDYRVHGPDIVGFSFFATAPDHNDGGPRSDPRFKKALEGDDDALLLNEDMAEIRRRFRNGHPRLYRISDLLGCSYAVILLTKAEFDAPFCSPPEFDWKRLISGVSPPEWLSVGSAAAFWRSYGGANGAGALEDNHLYKFFGQIPEQTLAFNREIRWAPRLSDPNAGKAPRESYSLDQTGYVLPYYWKDGKTGVENYREHDWVKGHKQPHIGGTMQPVQGIPEFSPYYIEFDETFGGYNFGFGNGQLDFRDMKFDWAC